MDELPGVPLNDNWTDVAYVAGRAAESENYATQKPEALLERIMKVSSKEKISAFMDTEGYSKLTRTGEHSAGGSYIDPLLQENPTLRDIRSDVFSVGAILYYLLCGHPPVGGDVKRFLCDSNTALTDRQVEVMLKSLSLDINERYSSCEDMKKAIKECV